MSFGRSVSEAIKAMAMATPVRMPNKTLGMKFDKAKIEKPTMMVMLV